MCDVRASRIGWVLKSLTQTGFAIAKMRRNRAGWRGTGYPVASHVLQDGTILREDLTPVTVRMPCHNQAHFLGEAICQCYVHRREL
jgi:hypothetical protein